MAMLYIIRGLPGSGKTTIARKLAERYRCNYFEADQFFERDGEYRFDSRFLSDAHRECFTNTINALNGGKDVIVSNTFTTLKEIRDYIDHAIANGHKVTVIHCEEQYGSIHNVPTESIERMKARWLTKEKLAETYNYGIVICTL